jgi:anthranilate synthase/aminodeoxychorismate synthase-like glutamine amidotransferase
MTTARKKLYFIDHYDSFSWNVIDWLRGDGSSLDIVPVDFDDPIGMQRVHQEPAALVISPGPRNPLEATPTIRLVEGLLGQVPILGICLGHQILGHIAGFSVARASAPFHGSSFSVLLNGTSSIFAGMPPVFAAATYNSLIVSGDVPSGWRVDAFNELGEIQALSRIASGEQPAFGVQFHPESFLTAHKDILRRNWLDVVGRFPNTADTGVCIQTSATAPLSMPS